MRKRLSSIKDQKDTKETKDAKRSSYYLRSKSKKAETIKITANPMRNSQRMNMHRCYQIIFSKVADRHVIGNVKMYGR